MKVPAPRAAKSARSGDTTIFCGRDEEDRWLEVNFDGADHMAQEIDLGFPDTALSAAIRNVAGGRIKPALLSADGLKTAKLIIFKIMEIYGFTGLDGARPAPAQIQNALDVFLTSIQKRWGDREGQWLNHWSTLALRFSGDGYNGDGEDLVYA